MDFIGIQNYTREIIRYAMFVPFLHAKIVNAKDRNVEMTTMEWEVYPESIYHILKKFQAYENIPPLIITENGAAFFRIHYKTMWYTIPKDCSTFKIYYSKYYVQNRKA